MREQHPPPDGIGRRSMLAGLGGVGAALIAGVGLWRRPGAGVAARAQATPAATAAWTPPSIPQPLPSPGGTPPPLVGAAPTEAAAPVSIENPASGGTPEAGTPIAGGEMPVTNPQEPAQPAATPAVAPDAATEAAPAAVVTLTADFRFDPAEVTVRVGQAVEWRNEGRSPQTVTADPARVEDPSHVALPAGAQPWDSGVLNAGDTFRYLFEVAGEYEYVSMPQEANGMLGRVIVQG